VALFSPLQGEPDVTHIRSVYSPVTTFFPKVAHATELDFFEVQDVSELQVGAFGIQEPSGFGRSAKLSEIEAVLVPGLVFDRTGARLGRGRGYYDRALAEYQGLKIGVCCSDRVVEHLPTETFDVFMDYIVTDYFILRPLWAPTKGLH
jgi:5-formyltetrahydrofolate cyclo-ligase